MAEVEWPLCGQVSFFPDYAGIGLGTYFLIDRRNDDFIDSGDIVD